MATHEILVYGIISDFFGVSAEWFAKEIATAEANGSDILVRVNSDGGSAFEGIAMYNRLAAATVPTTAVVDGIAASAASFIVQGAERRIMRPGTFLMIHNAQGIVYGGSGDMRKTADDLDTISSGGAAIYAGESKRTVEEMQALMDAETWFDGAAAVEAGLADEVQGGRDRVVMYTQSMILNQYRNTPAAVRMQMERDQSTESPPEVPAAPDDDESEDISNAETATTFPSDSDPADDDAPGVDGPEDQPQEQEVAPQPSADDALPAQYVREVHDICMRAGMPERASRYYEARTPVETVRAEVLDALCERQHETEVDGRAHVPTADRNHGWSKFLNPSVKAN